MKHEFEDAVTIGTPDAPSEGFTYCVNCGPDAAGEECARAEVAVNPREAFRPSQTVRHIRSGGVYTITMSPASGLRYEPTNEPCYAYTDGVTTWVRPKAQMEDGRFEAISRKDPSEERRAFLRYYGRGGNCHADNDGDCEWEGCPQLRDDEPKRSGRHCPLDNRDENE